MKRYLLALFYFLSVGWMPLSVHAANSEQGVIFEETNSFLKKNIKTAVRIHGNIEEGVTLILPENSSIEYDNHLRWRLLSALGK